MFHLIKNSPSAQYQQPFDINLFILLIERNNETQNEDSFEGDFVVL
jgi:hypothetical protein